MDQMRSIRLDTVFYTGWGMLASGCWIEVQQVGVDPEPQYRCTTRNGLLCTEDVRSITEDRHHERLITKFKIPEELNNDISALTEKIVSTWLDPDSEANAQWEPPSYLIQINTGKMMVGVNRRLPLVANLVHFFSYKGTRPENRTVGLDNYKIEYPSIPHLLEDVIYRVRMDWAFPYCLLDKNEMRTRLYPFNLKPSIILGRELKIGNKGEGAWNLPFLVRFKRTADFDATGIYKTEILDANGNVTMTILPPKPENWDPEWTKRKARLRLPNYDGFLLLHKYFLYMVEAYKLLKSYRMARSNVEKDLGVLKQIERHVELSGRFTMDEATANYRASMGAVDLRNPAADKLTRKQVAQALGLITRFINKASSEATKIDKRFNERLWPFQELMKYFGSKEHSEAWNKYWYRFDNFLGPATFGEMFVWMIRQSPLHMDFYNQHGEAMLKPSGVTWDGVRDQKKDPMLVDRRFQEKPAISDADMAMSWTKRSAKVYASVNQMFYFHHASALYLEAWSGSVPGSIFKFKPNRDQIKEFVKFITGLEESQAAAVIEYWVPSSTFSSSSVEIRAKVKQVSFHARAELPKIADAVDALQRVLRLVSLGQSLHEHEHEWKSEDVWVIARDVLGLTKSAAALAGWSGKAMLKKAVIPAAAAVEFRIYASQGVDAFFEDKYYDGSMRSIQAVGTALVLWGTYSSAVPVAGIPTATLLVLTGTAVTLGAELALWIEQNVNSKWENHAKFLYRLLQEPLAKFQGYANLEGSQVDTRAFADILLEYEKVRKGWKTWKINDGGTLWDLLNDDDTWDNFPEAVWSYLQPGGQDKPAVKKNYIKFCKIFDPQWNGKEDDVVLPPPPMPYPRPQLGE